MPSVAIARTSWNFSDWQDFFPYDTPRDLQHTIMGVVAETLQSRKSRGIVVEAGTGIGKTAMGMTFLRKIKSSGKIDPLVYLLQNFSIVVDIW